MWIWKKLTEIIQHRELIWNLVKRDLKARYKVSVLGFLWSLLRPLFMMLIFTIVFSKMFRWDIHMNVKYPLFLLCAILPWQFLTGALNNGAHCLLSNESLIKKVYLPREVFPIAAVLAELVNFLLSLLVLIPFLLYFHIGLSFWLIGLPVIILIEVILVLGFTLLVSSLNVFFRDTLALMDLGLMAWFYLSPVFYPVSYVQKQKAYIYHIYLLNPMTSILTGFRKVFLANGFLPDSGFGYDFNEWAFYLGIATGIAIIVLTLGWWVFHAFDEKLVDTL
jgi:lipopolysaccharide transport system permease protein